MYSTNNILFEQGFDKLQVDHLIRSDTYEVLGIILEAGCVFPEHTSPKNAHILVLEGAIDFNINNEEYHLSAYQALDFEANTKHYVKAHTDSRFLIIR